MSWIQEKQKKSYLHRFCRSILKTGTIPKHVAFIMDGNRRFASKKSLDHSEGHMMGFDRLAETLDWCLDLGITEVTVYAFSIENFKRSKEEVDGLMELAKKKFARLLEEKELINKHGVCVRVLGNISLLPLDIQKLIAEAMYCSRNNTRAILNVCFAYTSRDEICAAIKEVAEGVRLGLIKESDVSESVLEQCLYTNKSEDPDLLIRTSGEVRLSDFLLWQCSYSVLSFMRVLWPEFSVWHLFAAILHFQANYPTIQVAKQDDMFERDRKEKQQDYHCVLQEMESQPTQDKDTSRFTLHERVKQYTSLREARIQTFLNHVNSKRDKFIEDLCTKTKSVSLS